MFEGKADYLKSRVSEFTGRKGDNVVVRYITLLCGTEPIEFQATEEAHAAAKELTATAKVSVTVSLFRDFKGVLKGKILKLSAVK